MRIGVLGCGTVGASLLALLERQSATINSRTGLSLVVSRIAVRDLSQKRSVVVGADVFTDDALSVVSDPSIDIIVEVMGGIEPARGLVLALKPPSLEAFRLFAHCVSRCSQSR